MGFIFNWVDGPYRKMVLTDAEGQELNKGYVSADSTKWTDVDSWTQYSLYSVLNFRCEPLPSRTPQPTPPPTPPTPALRGPTPEPTLSPTTGPAPTPSPTEPLYKLVGGVAVAPDGYESIGTWQEGIEAAKSLGFSGDAVAHGSYAATDCNMWGGTRPQGMFRTANNGRFHFNCGEGGYTVHGDEILVKRKAKDTCWRIGDRVMTVDGSRYHVDLVGSCGTVETSTACMGEWGDVTFDNGFSAVYQYEDLTACQPSPTVDPQEQELIDAAFGVAMSRTALIAIALAIFV